MTLEDKLNTHMQHQHNVLWNEKTFKKYVPPIFIHFSAKMQQ